MADKDAVQDVVYDEGTENLQKIRIDSSTFNGAALCPVMRNLFEDTRPFSDFSGSSNKTGDAIVGIDPNLFFSKINRGKTGKRIFIEAVKKEEAEPNNSRRVQISYVSPAAARH